MTASVTNTKARDLAYHHLCAYADMAHRRLPSKKHLEFNTDLNAVYVLYQADDAFASRIDYFFSMIAHLNRVVKEAQSQLAEALPFSNISHSCTHAQGIIARTINHVLSLAYKDTPPIEEQTLQEVVGFLMHLFDDFANTNAVANILCHSK